MSTPSSIESHPDSLAKNMDKTPGGIAVDLVGNTGKEDDISSGEQ